MTLTNIGNSQAIF